MPVTAAVTGISAAVSYYGSRKAAGAATEAADIQAEAANRAVDLQAAIYQQQRADQAPWLHYGNEALSTMGSLMGLGGFTGAQVGTPALFGAKDDIANKKKKGADFSKPAFDEGKPTDVPGPGDQGRGWSDTSRHNDGLPIPMKNQDSQTFPGILVQMPDGSSIEVQPNELNDAIRLGGVVLTGDAQTGGPQPVPAGGPTESFQSGPQPIRPGVMPSGSAGSGRVGDLRLQQ